MHVEEEQNLWTLWQIRDYPPLTVFAPHAYGPLLDEAAQATGSPEAL